MAASAATCRQRKAECPDCGYTIRVSRKWLAAGLPTCCCGAQFTCPELEDAVIADPDLIEQSRFATVQSYNSVMRQLGHTDMIVRKAPPRRTRQRTCSHPSCTRFVAAAAETCAAGHVQQWARRLVPANERGEAMPF